MEPDTLKRLKETGSIFTYSEMDESKIILTTKKDMRVRPLYIIKESGVDHLLKPTPPIPLRESHLKKHSIVESNFKKKEDQYLEINLCVYDKHFVPDIILQSDILYFFIPDKSVEDAKHFFLITKDCYLDSIPDREHAIFGMIDIAAGKSLLLKRDHEIKPLMKSFYNKIDSLAQEYKDISFITISDSVLIKANFKMISDGPWDFRKFPNRMFEIIEIFKRIRKIIFHTFELECYGVFDYGMNKAETMKQGSPLNTFHTGILSNEFKNVINLEEKIKKVKKSCKSDLYFTQNFYVSAYVYLKEEALKTKRHPFTIEQKIELKDGHTLGDVTGIIVSDKPTVMK